MKKVCLAVMLIVGMMGCSLTDSTSTSESECTKKGGEWVCSDNPGPGGNMKCECDDDGGQLEENAQNVQFEPEPQPWNR